MTGVQTCALPIQQEKLKKLLEAREVVEEDSQTAPNPICARLRRDTKRAPMPSGLLTYSGSSCLYEHRLLYETAMQNDGHNENVMATMFSSTLRGAAMGWFLGLQPGSIRSHGQLMTLFLGHFSNFRRKMKPCGHLAGIVQRKDETLKDFIQIGRAHV